MNLAEESYEVYASRIESPPWASLSDRSRSAWMCAVAWIIGKLMGQHDWQVKKSAKVLADENAILRRTLEEIASGRTRQPADMWAVSGLRMADEVSSVPGAAAEMTDPHPLHHAALNACPCRYSSPCGDNCTCANPLLSGGCRRCCAYGSAEQRAERAKELIAMERERDEARVELARLSAIERLLDQYGHGLHRHYADNPIEAFQNRRDLAKKVCDAIGVTYPEAVKAAEEAIVDAPSGVSGSALIGLVRWYESALQERRMAAEAERDEARHAARWIFDRYWRNLAAFRTTAQERWPWLAETEKPE